MRSRMSGMIISVATSPEPYFAEPAYDFPNLFPLVDFINVMTYDLHGKWDKVTDIHTSLFGNTLSGDECINYWLSKGAPRDKLNMGMAFYGNSLTLKDPNNHGLGAPISNDGLVLNPGYNDVF